MSTRTQPGRSIWAQRQERGNLAVLRIMTWISLRLGRPLGRLLLRGIVLYFLLLAPAARRASRAYLSRVFGRPARWLDAYRHMLVFATTIHDRVYLLNERFDLFDLRVEGGALVDTALAGGRGALLLGAHFGGFEVLRAIGRTRPNLRVAIMMYEENARNVNAALATVNPAVKHDVIGLGRPEAMLEAREYLDSGAMIGMLADRALREDGGDAEIPLEFLGAPARFPLGPMRVAAMLRRPVIFMAGIYRGGNRYDLHFEALADFSETARDERAAAMHAAVQRYAALLEKHCRNAPYNWFNFFDFWHDGDGAAKGAPAHPAQSSRPAPARTSDA
ncbi:acyl-CoA synthetase [Trinickia caryophylli]|uniref:Predicted acyltransferase, LPLAT superfamily n=1 Tax=Trinickia caryophylli TaxID=28094 RepID=A0A1X7CED8_TRICW|nr:acyl-CoA synthetase [Trinickia caryophylli]PMS12585.1 acyl-CoA synthetase [Trinickia caryophylli]TRX19790.1 acyl-CoA synthetase [Trinickia caryophylli]WQE12881.1 acyl-CoA synthetase [Trinickia caryophylli]SME95216.1 Predicted acyltransferase, LPLAT superfamily [Trinickia caryophylli]GLU30604.1 acyltransferase [Trinickia caryophylli]